MGLEIIASKVYWFSLNSAMYTDKVVNDLLEDPPIRMPKGANQVIFVIVAVQGGHPDEWTAYWHCTMPDPEQSHVYNTELALQRAVSWGDKLHEPWAKAMFPGIADRILMYRS